MELVAGLPSPYRAEVGSLDAVEEASACLIECSVEELGHPDLSPATLHAMWTSPGVVVGRDVVLVRDPSDELVAVEAVENREPHVRTSTWGGVRPGHTDRGIGAALMGWAAAQARSRIDIAPPDAEVVHEVWFAAGHSKSESLMANEGFVVNRFFNQMGIAFDGPPQRPTQPAGIEIRQLRLGVDEEQAALTADEAFADHFGYLPERHEQVIQRFEHWLAQPDTDPSLFWIAWDGDEMAGHLWGWPEGDINSDYGEVGSLGVRRPWRGRGVGTALLLWSFGEFHRRGRRGAELVVDAESLTGALRLYESVGMSTLGAYAQGSRVLREGRSLATTTLDEAAG